jgi:hypothetical protein
VSRLYRAPVLLEADHELDAFVCRSPEQTEWLCRHARQSAASGATRVLVVTEPEHSQVAAYYARLFMKDIRKTLA